MAWRPYENLIDGELDNRIRGIVGGWMHFIQSVLGHSSVAVTERYYAKFSPAAAAGEVRRRLETGRKAGILAQDLAQGGQNGGCELIGVAVNP